MCGEFGYIQKHFKQSLDRIIYFCTLIGAWKMLEEHLNNFVAAGINKIQTKNDQILVILPNYWNSSLIETYNSAYRFSYFVTK